MEPTVDPWDLNSDDSPPSIFIQWKNTDICFDFQCVCSDPNDAYEFHFDGYLPNTGWKCPRCGRHWELSTKPALREIPNKKEN